MRTNWVSIRPASFGRPVRPEARAQSSRLTVRRGKAVIDQPRKRRTSDISTLARFGRSRSDQTGRLGGTWYARWSAPLRGPTSFANQSLDTSAWLRVPYFWEGSAL
jgi:hypothetical protein